MRFNSYIPPFEQFICKCDHPVRSYLRRFEGIKETLNSQDHNFGKRIQSKVVKAYIKVTKLTKYLWEKQIKKTKSGRQLQLIPFKIRFPSPPNRSNRRQYSEGIFLTQQDIL